MILFLTMLLAACGEKDCVEADDWGYPKVFVSAEKNKLHIEGELDRQVAEPIDSKQVIIDADVVPMAITVTSGDKWSSWFGTSTSGGSSDSSASDQIAQQSCQYFLADGVKNNDLDREPPAGPSTANDKRPTMIKATSGSCPGAGVQISNPDKYTDCRVTCYFQEGMGLYVGLSPDNGSMDDIVLTKHIPDSKVPEVPYDPTLGVLSQNAINQQKDGYLIKGVPSTEIPGSMTWDRLYFKIVDRYYNDNIGGYTVRLKEGTRSAEPGPMEKIVRTFTDPIAVVMEMVYRTLVSNQDYITAVRAALSLYIIFYAFSIMFGSIKGIQTDAVIRMLKIGVIVTLISPNSWEFFYGSFFGAFTDGVQTIATLLLNPFGSFDPASPWYSVDEVLRKLFSAETNSKILSTLMSNTVGFIYIPLLYCTIFLFLLALLRAVLVAVVGVIAIGILIMIAPFFIVFMLFDRAKELFDEWMSQFFAFAIQQIILFAGLGMFIAIIVSFMERTIGYRVCWNTWWDFKILGFSIIEFKFWLPDIRQTIGSFWMDANQDGVRGATEFATRYVDLPYFDITPLPGGGDNPDMKIIREYMSEKNFLGLGRLILFLASVFLMTQFMKFIPSLAGALQGGAGKEDLASLLDPKGGGKQLMKSLVATAIGRKNSASDKMIKNANNRFSRNFYAATGRSGGLLGGMARGVLDVAKVYQSKKGAKLSGKAAAKAAGGSGNGEGLVSANDKAALKKKEDKGEVSPVSDINKMAGKQLFNTELSALKMLEKEQEKREELTKMRPGNQNLTKEDRKAANLERQAKTLLNAALNSKDPRAFKAAAGFHKEHKDVMEAVMKAQMDKKHSGGASDSEKASLQRGMDLVKEMSGSQVQTVSRDGVRAAEEGLAKQRGKFFNDPISDKYAKRAVANAEHAARMAEIQARQQAGDIGAKQVKLMTKNANLDHNKALRNADLLIGRTNKVLNALERQGAKQARNTRLMDIEEQRYIMQKLGVMDEKGKATGRASEADRLMAERLSLQEKAERREFSLRSRMRDAVTSMFTKGRARETEDSIELLKAKERIHRSMESGAIDKDVGDKMIKAMVAKDKHANMGMRERATALSTAKGRKQEIATLDKEARDSLTQAKLEKGLIDKDQAEQELKKSEREFNRQTLEARRIQSGTTMFGVALGGKANLAKLERQQDMEDREEQRKALLERDDRDSPEVQKQLEILALQDKHAQKEADWNPLGRSQAAREVTRAQEELLIMKEQAILDKDTTMSDKARAHAQKAIDLQKRHAELEGTRFKLSTQQRQVEAAIEREHELAEIENRREELAKQTGLTTEQRRAQETLLDSEAKLARAKADLVRPLSLSTAKLEARVERDQKLLELQERQDALELERQQKELEIVKLAEEKNLSVREVAALEKAADELKKAQQKAIDKERRLAKREGEYAVSSLFHWDSKKKLGDYAERDQKLAELAMQKADIETKEKLGLTLTAQEQAQAKLIESQEKLAKAEARWNKHMSTDRGAEKLKHQVEADRARARIEEIKANAKYGMNTALEQKEMRMLELQAKQDDREARTAMKKAFSFDVGAVLSRSRQEIAHELQVRQANKAYELQKRVEEGSLSAKAAQLFEEVAEMERRRDARKYVDRFASSESSRFSITKRDEEGNLGFGLGARKEEAHRIARKREEAEKLELVEKLSRGEVSDKVALLEAKAIEERAKKEKLSGDFFQVVEMESAYHRRQAEKFQTLADAQRQREAMEKDVLMSDELRAVRESQLRRAERDAEKAAGLTAIDSALGRLSSELNPWAAVDSRREWKKERQQHEMEDIERKYDGAEAGVYKRAEQQREIDEQEQQHLDKLREYKIKTLDAIKVADEERMGVAAKDAAPDRFRELQEAAPEAARRAEADFRNDMDSIRQQLGTAADRSDIQAKAAQLLAQGVSPGAVADKLRETESGKLAEEQEAMRRILEDEQRGATTYAQEIARKAGDGATTADKQAMREVASESTGPKSHEQVDAERQAFEGVLDSSADNLTAAELRNNAARKEADEKEKAAAEAVEKAEAEAKVKESAAKKVEEEAAAAKAEALAKAEAEAKAREQEQAAKELAQQRKERQEREEKARKLSALQGEIDRFSSQKSQLETSYAQEVGKGDKASQDKLKKLEGQIKEVDGKIARRADKLKDLT